MSSPGGELRECDAEPTPFCTHGSINPPLWHLLFLGKGGAVANVNPFFLEQLPCGLRFAS